MNAYPSDHLQQGRQMTSAPGVLGTLMCETGLSGSGFTVYEDRQSVGLVFGHYHETLWRNAKALAYLKARKIDDPEFLDTFKVGFSDRSLGYRLPHGDTPEGGAARGYLQRVGVLRPSGHELFRGSVVFPVIDSDGDVLDAYGRKISPNLRAGTIHHTYLADVPVGIFNQVALDRSGAVILCKSPLEAATFWCAQHRNVVATMGLRGFSDEHLEMFATSGTDRLYIAFDNTPTGDRAARLIAQAVSILGIEVRRIVFPAGFDANATAVACASPARAFAQLIREARPFGQTYEQLREDAQCSCAISLKE